MENNPMSNIWRQISSATGGILQPENLNSKKNESNNTKPKNRQECGNQFLDMASVVNYTPVEGDNVIKRVSSSEFEPQICIETTDYVTIVYKKCQALQKDQFSTSIQNQNAEDHLQDTIAFFSPNNSYQTDPEIQSKDLNPSLGQLDVEDNDNDLSMFTNDSYTTAFEDVIHDTCFDAQHIIECAVDVTRSSSTSAVCGCEGLTHSRSGCPNSRKYDISLEADILAPRSFEEFCSPLQPKEKENINAGKNSSLKIGARKQASINRRNKRFLDLSIKVEKSSLNDSFPETVFPVRKRFTTKKLNVLTSTPARASKISKQCSQMENEE